MDTLISSLAAVFLIIVVGWAARQTRFIDDAAWRGFEAVTYHVLIPALVIHTLAYARLGAVPVLAVGGSLVLAALTMAGLLMAARPLLERRGIAGPAFTSVFQGAVRWNTFIALAVASKQFGAEGVALMAVVIASLIPLVNVLCVLVLSRYAKGESFDLRRTLATLARNPFIWSCTIGVALNPISGLIPAPVGSAVEIIGRASLSAGLLVAGAGLELSRLARPHLPHALSVGLKLLLMPLLVYGFTSLFGVTGVPLAVALVAATVPTAAASYILARQMGGDAPLMAEIATLQTLAAMLTMPAILLWLVPT